MLPILCAGKMPAPQTDSRANARRSKGSVVQTFLIAFRCVVPHDISVSGFVRFVPKRKMDYTIKWITSVGKRFLCISPARRWGAVAVRKADVWKTQGKLRAARRSTGSDRSVIGACPCVWHSRTETQTSWLHGFEPRWNHGFPGSVHSFVVLVAPCWKPTF